MPKTDNPNPMNSLPAVLDVLRDCESFLITTHVDPDGDAIGSMLAMRCLLESLGKKTVQCVVDGAVPRIYRWLPGAESILSPDGSETPCDCAVVLDAGELGRLGRAADRVRSARTTVVIDHHLGEAQGSVNFVDPSYAATGEIVLDLFELSGRPLSVEAAQGIYVAQITDTGGFRFSNTTARSHRMAATLLERGLDVQAIATRVFDAMSREKFELMKRVINSMTFIEDGRVTCARVSVEDMRAAGADDEDLNNLVNIGRDLAGVEIALLFREVEPGVTKVSLRSDPAFNSAAVAAVFGGGGHAAAAGARLACPLQEACERVLDEVAKALRRQG